MLLVKTAIVPTRVYVISYAYNAYNAEIGSTFFISPVLPILQNSAYCRIKIVKIYYYTYFAKTFIAQKIAKIVFSRTW